MMKKQFYILPALLIFALISCKQPSTNSDSKEAEAIESPLNIEMESAEDVIEDILEDENDDLQEFGIIENIEDGGYPFFVVTVNFIEREMKVDFNLNIEEITLDLQGLHDLSGKYATIKYTSEFENSLSDLQIEGSSLFGQYALKYDSNWQHIQGVLSGADEITPGDLPGMISITDPEGEIMDFEVFIDAETVAANGKMVDAFYDIRVVNKLTQIVPAEE